VISIDGIGHNQSFEWDANGNMVYHHDEGNSITQRLCWDEINRLIATSDGSQISHYIYDANGERAMKYNGTLSKQQINQYTLIDYALMDRYTYYPSPLLVFGSNGYSKHYFIEGQRVMSRIGDIWDAEAALIPLDATPDGVDLNNKADQIEAQLETHLACLALDGEVDYHVDLEWLGWETEPMVFFYHPDHLGSSSFITGATGEPTQHLEYLPFGELFIEERSTWNTPYKFSAKELDDETGYSYFGARYYDPGISIWLSVDPLSDEAPGWTPYRYAFNNPIRIIDPNGMFEDWVQHKESGEYVWMDGVTGAKNTPEGYRYIGQNDMDILDDLNIPRDFEPQTMSSGSGGFTGGEEGPALIAGYTYGKGRLKAQPIINYSKKDATSNNQLGRTFEGIAFTGQLSYMAGSSDKPDKSPNHYQGTLMISFGSTSVSSNLEPLKAVCLQWKVR